MIGGALRRAVGGVLLILFTLGVPTPLVALVPQVEGEQIESVHPEHDANSNQSFHFLGDTPAQWVMVATSAIALLVSIWAVWLLRGTLKATRDAVRSADDAVKETRRIGEAQTRAYVTITSIDIGIKYDDDGSRIISGRITALNSGLTPAANVVTRYAWASHVGVPSFEMLSSIDPATVSREPIGANGQFFLDFRTDKHAGNPDRSLSPEQVDDIQNGIEPFWFFGVTTYEDVFGEERETQFRYCLRYTNYGRQLHATAEGNYFT